MKNPSTAPLTIDQPISSLEDIHRLERQVTDPLGMVSSTFDLLRRGAELKPQSPAMSFFLRPQDSERPWVWNHSQWFKNITKAGNMFRGLGLQRGDVVAFVLPNLPETHWTIWGGEAAGIAMAINPLLEPPMMVELMQAARPKILVTLCPTHGSDLWQKATAAAAQIPSLRHLLTVNPLAYLHSPVGRLLSVVGRLREPRKVGSAKVLSFARAMRGARDEALDFSPPQLDDTASFFCTGGTTGAPKIARRSHRTEVANALQVSAAFGDLFRHGQGTVLCGLPLFHVNAQIGTGLSVWGQGAHVVLACPQGYRTPGLLGNFWDIAAFHRVSLFSGVPTVYATLLQHPPKGQDLSALRYGICGAAPMPRELILRFQAATGVKIIEGYGLTEGGCVSSLNPPAGEARPGSIGLRMPWQEMRVVQIDEEGRYVCESAVGEPGTLIIRGPNLFQGYLNEHHNRHLWIEHGPTEAGPGRWLNTGDLGRVDEQGYFWLTGRKKELIIRGGHNIDPRQIEDALCNHPCVALAAAVARPDAHVGEVPVAYVQLRPSTSAHPSDLLTYAQTHIPERAAWPRQVVVMDSLPLTAIGKIFKPPLHLRQLEAVVLEEAQSCGLKLLNCAAVQDSKYGAVVQWSADGNPAELRRRLANYTFLNKETV